MMSYKYLVNTLNWEDYKEIRVNSIEAIKKWLKDNNINSFEVCNAATRGYHESVIVKYVDGVLIYDNPHFNIKGLTRL